MFFLVVSTPKPAKPEEVKAVRLKFREWIASLKARRRCYASIPE